MSSSSKKGSKGKKTAGAEHVKKTLEAMKSGSGQKKYMGANSDDFLINMEFRNSLPAVPCGPYLTKIDVSDMYTKMRVKTESSLERNYIWQRHCPLDMNMAIRLEDQESVLGHSYGVDQSHKVNAILGQENYQLDGTADKSKREQKNDYVAANWWLRETRYGENQLFKNSNKKSLSAEVAEVDEHYYDVEVIERSFANILAHDDNDDVEWSLPILPDAAYGEQSYNFTRFDEDPEAAQTWEKSARVSEDEVEPEVEEPEMEKHMVGKKRMRESIITNVRDGKKLGSYAVTMVVPTLDSEAPQAIGDSGAYSWATDYAMNINKTTSANANYFFVVDHDSKSVRYHNVNTLVDMHRLSVDEVKPHNAHVTIVHPQDDEDN